MVLPPRPATCLLPSFSQPSAPMEESMVHHCCSDTTPQTSTSTHPHSPLTGCPSLTLASPGLGLTRLDEVLERVCSLCCVCHLYACPPTCPQMPVCVADSLLEHSCLEDDVFYSCDCDFNVSICLVRTRMPTHPEQKHKGSLLVLHKIFLNFFFLINFIVLFKLFICLFG